MSKQWYIGCSGFYYKDWKEVFYPKGLAQTKWFDFYCQHFNTLELNVTFYRFPTLAQLQSWNRKAPDGFVFAVKAPQMITHQKKFKGTESLTQEFYDILSLGFEDKLGPVLFQLPPSLAFSEQVLEVILGHMDPAFNNIIEFRHISWWRKEVLDALTKEKVTFCGVSFPGLIDDVIINSPTPYYRFHGVPKLYYSPYAESFLDNVVDTIKEHKIVKSAYLYFNNTAAASALDNARWVQQKVPQL